MRVLAALFALCLAGPAGAKTWTIYAEGAGSTEWGSLYSEARDGSVPILYKYDLADTSGTLTIDDFGVTAKTQVTSCTGFFVDLFCARSAVHVEFYPDWRPLTYDSFFSGITLDSSGNGSGRLASTNAVSNTGNTLSIEIDGVTHYLVGQVTQVMFTSYSVSLTGFEQGEDENDDLAPVPLPASGFLLLMPLAAILFRSRWRV